MLSSFLFVIPLITPFSYTSSLSLLLSFNLFKGS